MSGTLRDRMAELADDAPDSTPESAHELWRRGRRTARVRRGGTAVIAGAAVIALLAVVGVSWHSARPAAVQPAGGGAALPMEVWAPSKWLPGTDDKGPLGQLAAIAQAQQGTLTGSRTGYVGISATTGEYRFLDLPDVASFEGTSPVLSPDGRHVAYWLTGSPTGTPSTVQGDPVVGAAVYDTTTGATMRFVTPSEHGLLPDGLAWTDAGHVAFDYARYRSDDGRFARQSDPLEIWTVGAAAPTALTAPFAISQVAGAGDGELLISARHGTWLLQASDPAAPRRIGSLSTYSLPLHLRGDRAVAVPGNSLPARSAVTTLSSHGTQPWRPIPGLFQNASVAGWIDAHHVVAERRFGDFLHTGVVDLRTGTFANRVDHQPGAVGFQWALDLFNAPSAARDAPPTPMDPRLAVGLVVLVAVLGGCGVLVWRRRVRL